MTAPRRLGLGRKLVYSVVPLLLLLLAAEVVARCYYFQADGDAALGLQRVYRDWQEQRGRAAADAARQAQAQAGPEDWGADKRAFYVDPTRAADRDAVTARYAELLTELAAACRQADARLVMLFVPTPGRETEVVRPLFRALAEERDVPFVDVSPALAPHDPELVYLRPEDAHLSRFGHALVARALATALAPWLTHRTTVHHAERPALLGNLEPNSREVFLPKLILPTHLVTNGQGLRRDEDLAFPRGDRARVLFLGDWYTFGHGVHNQDTYPHELERALPEVEAVNAGVCGYTLCCELDLFRERARFVEADVVVLQVLENDLYGLARYLVDWYCRGSASCRGNATALAGRLGWPAVDGR